MSLTTDSQRSDRESTPAGLISPLYGTATFTSLSPSTSNAPLSGSGASSARLSYPSRSVTPSNSDDGPRLRRVAISPTASSSSYDSRRYTDSDVYSDDNDNSIADSAEVEEVLSRIDDSDLHDAQRDSYSSGHSSVSADTRSATGSYATATTEPLNFERERRSLSTISERTESQSLNSGIGAGTSILHNLFSSTFYRPGSFISAAARSLYGAPASPLAPQSGTASAHRPATPERTFRPALPTGRRVGNLVATFESDISQSRPGSVPLGPRSPSPLSGSSRPTSPTKSSHSRAYTDGSYTHSAVSSHTRSYTEGSISTNGHTHSGSFSSYLSPPPATTALSRSTHSSSETERPRSPLSSVRNIVAAWKERSPERASTAASSAPRSVASQSVVSGPSYSSGSMSSLGLFGGGFFSLRRRAALSATSGGTRSRGSHTDEFGSSVGGNTDSRSILRSGSVRSTGGSSIFDLSELGSFIRGSREPLRVGTLWYLNVHAPPPFRWQRCRAILYSNTLLLTWLASGGGRGVVTLDLVNCNEVRSVPSPSHISARDDIGTIAARLQMDHGAGGNASYDLVEMLCPFQLLYNDGVERLGAESARERVQWVGAIWDALESAAAAPERSTTMSPTGSIRTIRSATSSIISSNSGSGSATTTYLPPLDTIPDLSDLESTLTRSLTRQGSITSTSLSSNAIMRSRSSDDGALSVRDGLLHPFDARSIEIPPSRNSSLRRTSSLADLDAEFASVLRGTGITLDSDRTRSVRRGGSSRFSARWTREPSEYGAVTSTVSPSESASAAGVTRRVPASTFYTHSEPTFTQLSTESSSNSDVTEIIPSSLSLRGPSSASLLGDSHEGPPTSEDSQRLQFRTTPSTPARTFDTLYSSPTGLSRTSAVRRRAPRSVRSYSRSASSKSAPTTTSTSDKENEVTETEPSQWSSLQGSYTSTSIEYYDRSYSRTPSEPSVPLTPRQERLRSPVLLKAESESDEDVYATPTKSGSATSYHSLPSGPGTPTPSSTEFETAIKAPSTEYVTADICPSEPPSTEYVTAEVCPSTPPATEYFTAQCVCQPPSADQISSLTPSLSLTSLEEANIPLPESEVMSPESESTRLSPSPVPTPVIETPTPSSVTETSVETTSITPSPVPSPPPPSSPSTPSIETPSSPSSVEYRTESSRTPKSKSLLFPSQSSPKSTSPSVSDYESSVLAPSPSVQSIPIPEQADISFETSFMRPGVSEMLSEQSPSPFMPRGVEMTGLTSTVTPSSTSVGTTSSISPTDITRPSEEVPTGSSIRTSSSLSPTQVSTLTPSTTLLTVPPARTRRSRTPTPSSLTPSSYIEGSPMARSESFMDVSSVTPSGSPFEDESILSRTVTVTRTPSSVSSISTASMDSAIFAPSVSDEAMESPLTIPPLLSSRATTPRPTTPREVPLPSSPSLSIATATPSASVSTPRTDAQTLTSVVTTDVVEAPREEILTHDVNRLLRYLHDLDQIRGGETQDIKDHLQRIEGELRDLSDFLRKPRGPLKDRSVGSSVPVPGITPSERVSPPAVPAIVPQKPSVTSGSTPPLPVPAPRETQTPTPRGPTPAFPAAPTPVSGLTPPPRMAMSFSYSPSTISRDFSILESPRSEDLSLMSLRDYPAVPISPPGSPSSPSSFGSGWPSSSTDAPPPPSSVTPSTESRSSIVRAAESVSELTPESAFIRTTPVPLPSPLASLATTESALPLPPQSSTPSQEPRQARVSPMAAGPYAGSPLPTPSSLEPSPERSLSLGTPPPSSSMPSSMPSSTPPSFMREGPSAPEVRQPASPVLSVSEIGEPTPRRAGSAVLSDIAPAAPPPFPTPAPGMPIPDIETVPPSPIVASQRSPSPAASRALDDLRDLLEDLREQAQALWNGQLATNRMLDDLIARGQPGASPPSIDRDELGNRLRNIEDLLDGILRDLERGFAPEEPSDISSDTSSALRRYIDRLRERRQDVPGLQMPTPVRAPPPALDPEWLEFLSEPPPITERPIQGPPELPPLYRRAPRRRREVSISPPISIELPPRPSSVPPSAPSWPLFDAERPWRWPRVPRRRLSRPSVETFYEPGYRREPVFEFDEGRPQRPRPQPPVGRRTRPESGPDIDMLDEIHRLRQRRRGGDGRYDVTRRSPSWEEVPPPPPVRPSTAPPGEYVQGPWIQPGGRPEQMLRDTGTIPVPAAGPPQPVGAVPGAAPTMIPMLAEPSGPRPPYDEMLHLLRQNRLAQTASIDQQREIMRYMRALNQWLENDVRDRHREMRSIADRVDALRGELTARMGGVGIPGAGIPMPLAGPGQPPPGQTYIVPPMPPGIPVIPPGMPMPGPYESPGEGPHVIPPAPQRPFSPFVPPPPSGQPVPVVPPGDFGRYPSTAPRPSGTEPYTDYDRRRSPSPPFIPPRPSPSMVIPVPPPMGPPGPPMVIQPPVPVSRSPSRTPSSYRSSRTPSPRPSVHVHVPTTPSQRPPSGPLRPDIQVPSAAPLPVQQPLVIQPPPTQPTFYPGIPPEDQRGPLHVINRSRSPSPTRIAVPPRPPRTPSPLERRPTRSDYDRPRPHRRSPSPPRRHYEEPDRGRPYSRSRSRTPPPVVVTQPPVPLPPPQAEPFPVFIPSRPRSRSRSRSPRTPPPLVVQQPGLPPVQPQPPVLIQPQPQPPPAVQPTQPTVVVPSPHLPPPTAVRLPTAPPSQPPPVFVPSRRSPSPPVDYAEEDRPHRLRRIPRSPSPGRYPDRDRERDQARSPRRRTPSIEADRPRVHRPPSPYGPPPSRPPTEEADMGRGRRPASPYERSPSRPITTIHVPGTPMPRAVERVYSRPASPTRVAVGAPGRVRSVSPTERVVVPPPPHAGYARPGSPTEVVVAPPPVPGVPERLERSPTFVPVPPEMHVAPSDVGYPPQPVPPPGSPGAAIRSAIHSARSETEPIIPLVPAPPSDRRHAIPPEPIYPEDVPQVTRRPTVRPVSPSGPGDLAFQEALQARDERLDEQERRLEELSRAAVDAEDRREQYFREYEEERDRRFRENKERRFHDLDEIREEFEHIREDAEHIKEELERSLEEIPRRPVGIPPERPHVEGAEPSAPRTEAERVSERASIAESMRPVPPPVAPVAAEGLPQLQEILDLLRAQQTENARCKAEQQERFDILRDEIDQARADAKAECEERIRLLEDELASAREELEHEREQRRAEDLERIEREHADVIERDEAMRAQLGDITNLVQEQREELARKRELMDERWTEKERRREDKQGRSDAMYEMLERILQEREQERRERELEREAVAQRPNIETVLDELRRQNEQQIQLINNLTEAWRADSARQHEDTLNAVRATAQEMVPYNLTGYLDEFSKALAGEIRTLISEVGRLHEQKRTLQFEIGSLLHMYSQYGPGGQFEPDWHPTMGPLAPPHIPGGGGEPPPGPGGPPPPGPEEPPPPARPAWRTVQQRAPRRRRTAKTEASQPGQQAPGSTLAPPEPIPHPPSWATWQPNPAFVPSPLSTGASPLVVPPSGPTGLFGPRSPRGTMYGGN